MSQKICLIDGSGYIFRAFYGLPPLTSPEGIPVNAVYGFTNMFLKLTTKIPCDYCLVLFDAKRQNFRNEIFSEYKGTRKDTPEELIPQFPIIREAVNVLNINHLEMEGYEADDLIATYAKQALEKGLEVVIVSGDKDLMQLIRTGVEFYDPMKDKFFTPEDVKEKFGVYPDKVVDVQALSGDSIDNVPGVAGIGPKTAAQLVEEYGSLEGILEHVHEIKQEKRRQTLIDNAENALISLKLVTLKDDVPVEKGIEDFHCKCPDADKMHEFINKYGFNSLKNRVEKWLVERCSVVEKLDIPQVIKKQYFLVDDEDTLKQLSASIKRSSQMAVSVISTGQNYIFDDMIGLAVSSNVGESYYIPLNQKTQSDDLFSVSTPSKQISKTQFEKYLKPLFESKSILKIGSNIKNSMHFIIKYFGKTNFEPYDDISVMSYCLSSSEHAHDINTLAKVYFDEDLPKLDDIQGSGKNKIELSVLETEVLKNYICEQADYICRLHDILKQNLISEKRTSVYEIFDRPLIKTLFNMECRGVKINSSSLRDLSFWFDKEMKEIEKEIFTLAGEEFNIGSPKQIGEILFTKKGLKGKKTASGAWATGAEVLEALAEEGEDLASKILQWREISKLKSTYTDSLFSLIDKEGRIHTTYAQTVANTGRLASNNPNLQNIPIRSEMGKKIRSCFIAKEGYKLISCDYSQVELRLLADVADVKKLKQAFAEGIDIHTATASHVFGVKPQDVDANLRRQAKAINFGVVYGISAFGLSKNINSTPAEAKAYIDAYFEQMPEIKAYMDKTIAFAQANGYVETPFGRKCSVLGINDSNKRIVANAERAAINAPIQGGAADIIKLAMNKIETELKDRGLKTKMLLQVHDELVFEAPENEVDEALLIIKEHMEKIVDSSVEFKAEAGIGNTWTEAH
ncbi:MAG: DNA polymerase I [Alphaproteobacteria bacterium]|nr:DNA polymerase I [Alphaproteobacteria bacterium]